MSPATPSLLTPLLAFALILIAIPLLLWMLKRSPVGARLGMGGMGGAGASAPPARLVASLPVGPQQRVLTLEVGQGAQRRWLLVGLTPQGMATLHTMEAPSEGVADAAASFATAAAAAPPPGRVPTLHETLAVHAGAVPIPAANPTATSTPTQHAPAIPSFAALLGALRPRR